MLYTEVLTKNGITAEAVSHGIRVKIKQYEKLSEAVEKAKAELPNAKTPRKKIDLEREITTGEENLVGMNDALCDSIQKNVDNAEVNKKKAANLKKARENRGKVNPKSETVVEPDGTIVTPDTPEVVVTPEVVKTETTPEVVKTETTAATKADDKNIKDDDATEPKKKSSVGGLILGAVVFGVLAALGIRVYNKSQE